MTRQKKSEEERAVIRAQPHKRPYGVNVRFCLQTAADLGEIDEVCVSIHTGAYLSIKSERVAPWQSGKKYMISLEGFPTAVAAEAAGRRLVQALLWMAVTTDTALRLEYVSYEPAAVFERNRSNGSSMTAYLTVGNDPTRMLGELQDGYRELPEPNQKLLLSMEIFCSAGLESSQRTRYLSIVSALEPLAEKIGLGDRVAAFVQRCVSGLKASDGITPDIQRSLEGRLLELRSESIGQALKRLIREQLPDHVDAPQIVEEAYALRSQLVHGGVPSDLDVDLDREARAISKVIRAIYASILGRPLLRDG